MARTPLLAFRATDKDLAAIAAVRQAYTWITTDADALRAALALAVEALGGLDAAPGPPVRKTSKPTRQVGRR